MPLPLGLVKFVCPRCRWQRTIRMKSDVLIKPEWAHRCPQCGCDHLQTTRGNHLESVLGAIAERLSQTFD